MRTTFPLRGLFEADAEFLDAATRGNVGEYRYVKPAAGVIPECEIGGVWIVDRHGRRHPGLSVHPVPCHRDNIGARVTRA
jgi:hypothetical protein